MMNRDDQLQHCKICVHQQMDPQQGIVCGLTSRLADFEGSCPTFKLAPGAMITDLYQSKPYDPQMELASSGKRFANYLIDFVGYFIVVVIIAFAYGLFVAVFFPDLIETIDKDMERYNFLLTIVAYMSYYLFFESVIGVTPGKWITGTRVVDAKGNIPSTGTIFKRSLARLVPFEPFSFLGNPARGWHDVWTDTYVVTRSKS